MAPAPMELSKDNIVDYLFTQTDVFNRTQPIGVEELSGDDSFTDSEGYVNFIFRVTQGDKSYIVKQSRNYLRIDGIVDSLPVERNYMEYVSFALRNDIAYKMAPQMYFVDKVNNVFMMEDMMSKNMRVMRFQLSRGREFPHFAKKVGKFLARNHFYTSELFLDKPVFREMQINFANLQMRAIMEDQVLRRREDVPDDTPLGKLSGAVWNDPEMRRLILEVRDILLKKGECLVHGDFHTSNIFVDDENIRVIDMEYSFVGPYALDLGYLLANFVAQYAAFQFNTAFSMKKRESFQRYLLDTIEGSYAAYFENFKACFDEGAKPLYKTTPGYCEEYLFPMILQEALGIQSAANAFRILNLSAFPDFDCIEDPSCRFLAQGLSVAIDEHLLRTRKTITTPRQAAEAIQQARDNYLQSLR